MITDRELYCVIVTYNNRWPLLESVLSSLSTFKDLRIVLVVNGSDSDSLGLVATNRFNSFHIIYSPDNKGSAWGFGAGMQYVADQNHRALVLLLDDDNVLEKGALHILIDSFQHNLDQFAEDEFMLMSYRTSRTYLKGIVEGFPVERYQFTSNEFLGFSFPRLIKRIGRGYVKTEPAVPLCLNYAPYGGLFFSATIIKKFGLPKEHYFVYADDFEYTSRCVRGGVKIFLISKAIVLDLEQSWQSARSEIGFNILFGNPFRVYYSVRNFIAFQQEIWVSKRWLFLLNGLVYSVLIMILALYRQRWSNFRIYKEAVKDGLLFRFDNTKWRLHKEVDANRVYH